VPDAGLDGEVHDLLLLMSGKTCLDGLAVGEVDRRLVSFGLFAWSAFLMAGW
jgi:hypothetical protein